MLHGRDLSRLASRERARSLAWLGQATADTAADDLTVYDVALLGRLPHLDWLAEPGEADHAAVARALQQTQAWAWRDRPLGALSGGERQRVLLARALAVEAVGDADGRAAGQPGPAAPGRLAVAGARAGRQRQDGGERACTNCGMVLQADDVLVLDAGRVRHLGACHHPDTHRALEAVFDHRIAVRALDDQWVALPR